MGKKFFSRKEGRVTVLFLVDMTEILYCSYWDRFHYATICGIAGLPEDVKEYCDLYHPDTMIADWELKVMTPIDEKTKTAARRATNCYWRKGDVWGANKDIVREGIWCKAHKHMPPIPK